MKVDFEQNKAFINSLIKNNEISKEVVDAYDRDLRWYVSHHFSCSDSAKKCEQENRGYQYDLRYENNRFYRELVPCEHTLLLRKEQQFKTRFLIADFDPVNYKKSFFTTNDQNIAFFNLDFDNELEHKIISKNIKSKNEFITKHMIVKYYQEIMKNKKNYGLYLYGGLGVGKTTLLQFLAIDAALNHQKTIAFISVSNLINLLKDSFNNHDKPTESIIHDLQVADLLFLDDIGGEPASEWLRDDVLFTILNYRMENRKITFFSSNFSIERLGDSYLRKIGKTFSSSNEDNELKNRRFLERIHVLTKEIRLDGENHRHQ